MERVWSIAFGALVGALSLTAGRQHQLGRCSAFRAQGFIDWHAPIIFRFAVLSMSRFLQSCVLARHALGALQIRDILKSPATKALDGTGSGSSRFWVSSVE